jgi:hypothetical protein
LAGAFFFAAFLAGFAGFFTAGTIGEPRPATYRRCMARNASTRPAP